MSGFTRRQALLTGAAAAAFASCAQESDSISETAATDTSTDTGPDTSSAFIDGVALAKMLADGETTAEAELDAALARAESVNGDINAIATKTYDQAREQLANLPDGTFKGVPTFIKDLLDWKGAQTLWGSRAFVGNIAAEDHNFAADWRGAGMVSLGKSTSPEMGLISTTEPLVTGPTRNPWNTDRITGGSSGGAAALVAARVVPYAHASDGGGSIRIPASTCGLFGLKPSASRLSGRPGSPPVDISVNHAVTWTVRDSVELFRIAERNDGRYAPLGEVAPMNRKLRIGFAPASTIETEVAGDTMSSIEQTAALCEELGHDVIPMQLDVDGKKFADDFMMYWAAGAADFAKSASEFSGKPIGPDIVEPWTLGLAQFFMNRQAELPRVIADLIAFKAKYDSWFDDIDVLLTPVTGRPADPIGYQDSRVEFDELMDRVLSFAAFTSPMNVAGAASMSVPLGMSSDGLPIGSMFSAKEGEDELLFSLAYQLEEAKPWINNVPPLVAG